MTKGLGSYDMGMNAEVRKTQWKCPFLIILIMEALMWSFGKAACPVCYIHCKEQERENLSGKWQTRSSLTLLKTWAIGRGWNVRLYLRERGKEDRKHFATHRYCPNWGGNFGVAFCPQSMSSSFDCFLPSFSSVLCLSCLSVGDRDTTWSTVWPNQPLTCTARGRGQEFLSSWKSHYP